MDRLLAAGIPSVSWSTTGKTLEYGKMYMVWFFDHTVSDFEWYIPGASEEPAKKMESEYFSYTELPDYEVIDVLDIPEEVIEIGVFEEETCVGAVVVQSTDEQILVYSDKANRDVIPFSFEIVTDIRGLSQPVNNYLVFNKDTGEFENGHIISGRQELSIIKFGDIGEPQNEPPAVNSVVLHNNYPNPFNYSTTIELELVGAGAVELAVYNIKGQKVKALMDCITAAGTYKCVWNGKDEHGRSAGSGQYLVRLQQNGK